MPSARTCERHPPSSRLNLPRPLGCRIVLKCENLNPTGAFKVRGGMNLLAALTPEERTRGVVAASTGNHGQSVAYAARLFGGRATIFMPEAANPLKVAATEPLGARLFKPAAISTRRGLRRKSMPSVTACDSCILRMSHFSLPA